MSISVFFVFERTYDGFQLLCAHFAHALYRTLGPDAQRPAREHSGAQPHGGRAGARARCHPARHIPRAVRCQRPRDRGALSRRVGDPHGRPADADQVPQRGDHVGLPRGGGSGRAEAARHAAAGAARDLRRRARRGQERRHLPAREGGRQALGLHQVHRGAQGRQQRVSLRRGADARGARCLAPAGGAVFSGTFHSRVRARS